MKIDKDLRAAITAAARSQTQPTWQEEKKQMRDASDAFLKKSPSARRAVAKALKLAAQCDELDEKQKALRKQQHAALKPFGLSIDKGGNERHATVDRHSDEDQDAFTKAGGTLPPPHRRHWKADEVIAKLAAATPDKLEAILAEYGINWS